MFFDELDCHLETAIQHNLNVLLEGPKGVGKTSVLKNKLQNHGLRVQYFSCSTLDPIMHFCGIPKQVENGDRPYLDFVLPSYFAKDEVDAIILDEINRGRSEVHNALMELMLFKSINGKKLNNLKVIWAAMNPPNEGYDVAPLDPAVEGRFQFKIIVPNELNTAYLKEKYHPDFVDYLSFLWGTFDQTVKSFFDPRRFEWIIKGLSDNIDVSPMCGKYFGLIQNKTFGFYKAFLNSDVIGRKALVAADLDSTAAVMKYANSTKNNKLIKMLDDAAVPPELKNANIQTNNDSDQKLIDLFKSAYSPRRFDFDLLRNNTPLFTGCSKNVKEVCVKYHNNMITQYSLAIHAPANSIVRNIFGI